MTFLRLLLCSILWPALLFADNGLTLLGAASAPAASYTPATYYSGATIQFWYDFSDSTKVLKTGGTPALNGEGVETVNPSLGTPVATQVTGASQPLNNTGVTNGRQGSNYNGSKLMNLTGAASVLSNKGLVQYCAVFSLTGTAANAQMFGTYDNSYSFRRFLPFLSGNLPALTGERLDSTATSTVTSGTALATATVHAVCWKWNVTAGTVTITANNAATSITGTAFSTAGSIANTTLNEPRIGNLADLIYLDAHLATDALMTAPQEAAWYAAVKTKFGITVY